MKATKEGKRFLLATALIAFAALNTGNNLIYLIFSMMLSIVAVALALLFVNLRKLSITVSFDGQLYAGQAAALRLSLANHRWFAPAYSLRVVLPDGMTGEGFLIPYCPASKAVSVEMPVVFNKRGVLRVRDFFLESGYPFIFFLRQVKVKVDSEVVVYPEVKELKGLPMPQSAQYGPSSLRPGMGEEMLLIREFRPGDDAKKINWKATAKENTLMLKETAREEPRRVSLLLDNTGGWDKKDFERAVSFAASLAWLLIGKGFYVSLVTCAETVPFGQGREHLFKILYMLAVLGLLHEERCDSYSWADGPKILLLESERSAVAGFKEDGDVVFYPEEIF